MTDSDLMPEPFLIAFIQVSIASLAVAGIIGIIRNKDENKLSNREVIGIRHMIEHCFTSFIMSCCPIVLGMVFRGVEMALKISTSLFFFMLVALLIRNLLRISSFVPKNRDLLIFGWFVPTTILIGLLAFAIQRPSPGIYATSLVWLTVAFFIQVYNFVSPTDNTDGHTD